MPSISDLPLATLPLTGAELAVLVQNGVNVKTPINTLTVLTNYTVAALPPPTVSGALVYVTNEVGGAIPAFADGVNWRRVSDRGICSDGALETALFASTNTFHTPAITTGAVNLAPSLFVDPDTFRTHVVS